MADSDYDAIKALHEMLDSGLEDELKFKIHTFLAKFQYTDPDKEVEVFDVEEIDPSGVINPEAEVQLAIEATLGD